MTPYDTETIRSAEEVSLENLAALFAMSHQSDKRVLTFAPDALADYATAIRMVLAELTATQAELAGARLVIEPAERLLNACVPLAETDSPQNWATFYRVLAVTERTIRRASDFNRTEGEKG